MPREAVTTASGANTQRSGRVKGYVMAAMAAVTCPCHLLILAVLLSGTAAGALLADYLVPALVLLTVLFLLSLRTALRLLGGPAQSARPK